MWQSAYYQAVKPIRTNSVTYVTKPDGGAGLVILNKKDYINKILQDSTKFCSIGHVGSYYLTDKTRLMILDLVKMNWLFKSIYNRIRPVDAN